MARFLIHVCTGPENPTRATLALLVAATAVKEGHQVDVFLAGDGTYLFRQDHMETLEGLGTGRLKDHCEAVIAGGGRFYLSGMSAKARGMGQEILTGRPAEFAMPDVLVRLAAAAETTFCY